MTFDFSFLGLLFLIMLFVPNIIWSKFQPVDYESYSKNENRILLALERIGQVTVTCFALFSGMKFSWSPILIFSFISMVLYELYWIRYFRSDRTMEDMNRNLWLIPLPGATLPVFAGFLLGIYSKNIFLVISTIILGIGHIGIHYSHKVQLN